MKHLGERKYVYIYIYVHCDIGEREYVCIYICTLWYRPYIGAWYLQCQVWLFSLFDPGYTVWRVWEGVGQWVWWELWSSLAANLYSLPETEVCHFPFCKLCFDVRLQVFWRHSPSPRFSVVCMEGLEQKPRVLRGWWRLLDHALKNKNSTSFERNMGVKPRQSFFLSWLFQCPSKTLIKYKNTEVLFSSWIF